MAELKLGPAYVLPIARTQHKALGTALGTWHQAPSTG
jgi:hypothetical protein